MRTAANTTFSPRSLRSMAETADNDNQERKQYKEGGVCESTRDGPCCWTGEAESRENA